MLLFVDNQHSCLKAYAVTLLDGCFSEARSAVIRINVDPRGKKKKDDCSAFQTNRCSTRPRMQPMLLHSTKRITRALILFSTGYRSCSFFFLGGEGIENATLAAFNAVITIFLRDFIYLEQANKISSTFGRQ